MGRPKGISSKSTKVPHADNADTKSGRTPGEGVAAAKNQHVNHKATAHHAMGKTIPTHDEARNARFEAEGRSIKVQK